MKAATIRATFVFELITDFRGRPDSQLTHRSQVPARTGCRERRAMKTVRIRNTPRSHDSHILGLIGVVVPSVPSMLYGRCAGDGDCVGVRYHHG